MQGRAGFLERLGPSSLDPTEGLRHDAEKVQFKAKEISKFWGGGVSKEPGKSGKIRSSFSY